MLLDLHKKELSTLLAVYHNEVENLKSMLLEGKSWDEMQPVRRTITELAITIHKSHNYIVHDDIGYLQASAREKSNSGNDESSSQDREESSVESSQQHT